MKAVIVQAVEVMAGSVDTVAELPNRIPLMKLESGETVPAYNCHRYVELGTEGEATYDEVKRVWTFTETG